MRRVTTFFLCRADVQQRRSGRPLASDFKQLGVWSLPVQSGQEDRSDRLRTAGGIAPVRVVRPSFIPLPPIRECEISHGGGHIYDAT